MRVLHLLASPVFSGPAELVTQLALAQREAGHQVTVAIDRKRTKGSSEEPALPRLAALGLLDEEGLELSVKSTPFGMLHDVRRIRRLPVDVFHCHFSHDHTLVRLGRASRARLVRSIHAPRSLRWTTPSADGWTVPVEAWARPLLGAPVLVLPPLIDPIFVPPSDRAAHKRALGFGAGPVVGMVSAFQASRRHDVGLAAFARLRQRVPAAQLVLAGDGVEEGTIRATTARLGLEAHVIRLGYVAGRRFVEVLQALDELWVLGLGNDFSGRAAAQARACGARVVAVDEGGLERWADVLVPCEPAAVAAAALGERRREVALEAPGDVARRVLDLYRRVLG